MSQKRRRKGLVKLLTSNATAPWVIADLFLSFVFFYFFAILFGRDTSAPDVQKSIFYATCATSFLFILMGLGFGLFERENRVRRLESVKLTLASWIFALALGITAMQFIFFVGVGRYSLVYGSIGAIVAVLSFHFVMGALLRRYPIQIVFIGEDTPIVKDIRKAINSTEITKFPYSEDKSGTLNFKNVTDLRDLEMLLDSSTSLDFIFTSRQKMGGLESKVAAGALRRGIRVVDETSFYAEAFRRYPVEHLSPEWFIRAGFNIHKPMINALKRMLDFLFSFFLLVVLLPLLVLISALIFVSDFGPIFYLQKRQGRYSKPFTMFKFRTMKCKHNGPSATQKNDSRITLVGKILRPLHLDELPQLLNIFLGQMSFVGPRPEAHDIVERTVKYLPLFDIRHMVRPGLTGWAQITQGKTTDELNVVREKLSYDLYYARNYGLIMDALIVVRTLFVLTKGAW